jgi:AraC-like DNA-binding protein
MKPTMARDDMHYWRLQPDARLRPWVSCYWMVEPNHVRASGTRSTIDECQLLIPDGHSEIVFRLAGRFARWRVDAPAQRTMMRSSYVIGGRSHSVLTRSFDAMRLAGVKLDPRALRALIRAPLGEFRDATVSFADLGCRPLLDLEDAVANVQAPEQLAATLDAFFLRRLSERTVCETAIGPLIERLRQSRGAQSILGWAREHALDARTLERRFVAWMGMTPKQYARVVRFKHTYHRLASDGRSVTKAHLDNFYDESHFSREFRHFLGTSPLKWLAQSASFRTTVADHLIAGEFDTRLTSRPPAPPEIPARARH